MKKLIFFITSCCLLYSCNYKYHNLPQDKTPVLKNNDIIYFQDSASSKVDTFRLAVKDNWWLSSENEYFRNISIYYNSLNSTITFLVFGITSASVDGANFGIESYSSKVNYNFSFKTINFSIQGITYQNVYVGHDKTILSPDTIPNTVYFTCTKGIIRYEYKDGRVYVLMNK
jgi:hypothetical protein